jgi:hypothetical protein
MLSLFGHGEDIIKKLLRLIYICALSIFILFYLDLDSCSSSICPISILTLFYLDFDSYSSYLGQKKTLHV